MARYFFDTGAFVKFYHAEAGRPRVTAIFAEQGEDDSDFEDRLREVQASI